MFRGKKKTLLAATTVLGVALTVALLSTSLFARPFCPTIQKAQWLSVIEIEQKIKDKGLRLVSLRLSEDRCYKALAINVSGDQYEIHVHPASGQIIHQSVMR